MSLSRQHHKEFEKCIRSISHRHHLWDVFRDFCELAALSLANAVVQDEKREARYMQTIGRYTKEEAQAFPKLLGMTTFALEGMDCDFLGEVFMQMDLGSHWHGQFFTPFPLQHMMAQVSLSDAAEIIERDGFITISEPACGAGGMVIACARTLRDMKINYQQAMHVMAVDVDSTAAYMAYIQLTLLHIPAVVTVGNTLTREARETLRTFAHDAGLWDFKLSRKRLGPTEAAPIQAGQMALFDEAVA